MSRWLVLFGCAFALALAAPMGLDAEAEGERQDMRRQGHGRKADQVAVQVGGEVLLQFADE